jgi:hypothetical protein
VFHLKLNESRFLRFGTFAAALIASAGMCAAQQSDLPKDDGALKGPEVKDGGAPGKNRKFTEKGGKGAAEQREVPMRQYVRAFGVLKDGKGGEGAALTVDQQERIDGIVKDYGDSVETFRKENGEEVKELVKILPPEERRKVMAKLAVIAPGGQRGEGRPGEGRPGGDKGDAPKGKKPADGERPNGERPNRDGDPMSDGASKQKASQEDIDVAMKRLKELGEAAPKPADAQAKLWAVLSDSQKPLVKAELERMKVEAEKRRAENGGQGGPGEGMTPEMREKLKNMTPEERQKAIQEFRKQRQAEGGAPAGKEGAGKEGKKGKKPKKDADDVPPGMDGVDVPDPE